MNLVFVYGTLKHGGNNHRYLTAQRFVGSAQTSPGYRLFELSGYPGMVHDGSSTSYVTGEVWEVDSAALAELDHLEGLDECLYQRVPLSLLAPFDRAEVETYLYARDVSGLREIGPTWPEH